MTFLWLIFCLCTKPTPEVTFTPHLSKWAIAFIACFIIDAMGVLEERERRDRSR